MRGKKVEKETVYEGKKTHSSEKKSPASDLMGNNLKTSVVIVVFVAVDDAEDDSLLKSFLSSMDASTLSFSS